MSVWGSLDAIKHAVKEGVKEFSQVSHAALVEVRHNVEKVVIDGVEVSFDKALRSGGGSYTDRCSSLSVASQSQQSAPLYLLCV